jgi:ABC-2 type transport system ATP-binding protein
VRRDILEAVIRTVTDQGRTVLFSSHLLDEVERVSDRLAMLHGGALRFCASLDDIRSRHRRLVLHFDRPLATHPEISGAIRIEGEGRSWTIICDADRLHPGALAQSLGATLLEDAAASLDEIFVAHAKH